MNLIGSEEGRISEPKDHTGYVGFDKKLDTLPSLASKLLDLRIKSLGC